MRSRLNVSPTFGPASLAVPHDLAGALRTEIDNSVGSIILARAAEHNMIAPQLRDELAAAVDKADRDHATRPASAG